MTTIDQPSADQDVAVMGIRFFALQAAKELATSGPGSKEYQRLLAILEGFRVDNPGAAEIALRAEPVELPAIKLEARPLPGATHRRASVTVHEAADGVTQRFITVAVQVVEADVAQPRPPGDVADFLAVASHASTAEEALQMVALAMAADRSAAWIDTTPTQRQAFPGNAR